MAQGFDDFAGLSGGDPLPDNLGLFGDATATIEDDPDALSGAVLRIRRDYGGGSRGVILLDAPTGGGVNPRAMYARVRYDSGSRFELVLSRSGGSIGYAVAYLRKSSVEARTRSSVDGQVEHTRDVSNYVSIYVHLDDGYFEVFLWEGDPANKPDTPVLTVSGSSDAGNYSDFALGISGNTGDEFFVDRYGWGTDGDAAPTEPVDDANAVPTNLQVTQITADAARLSWEL